MFKTKAVNLNNNIIETLYQNNINNPINIIDLSVANLRKDFPIFIDIWLEKIEGRRFYLEYNTQLKNYSETNGTENKTYKNPLKLIALEKGQRLRAKTYIDIANSTSSTPSDWGSTSLEDWSEGQPWSELPDNNLAWYEGTTTDWLTGFDHWFTYTINATLTNVLNASLFLTLDIEDE